MPMLINLQYSFPPTVWRQLYFNSNNSLEKYKIKCLWCYKIHVKLPLKLKFQKIVKFNVCGFWATLGPVAYLLVNFYRIDVPDLLMLLVRDVILCSAKIHHVMKVRSIGCVVYIIITKTTGSISSHVFKSTIKKINSQNILENIGLGRYRT